METKARETRYQELFDRYRAQIAAGTFAPGDRLPSFPDLRAQGYGQATVEKALQMLEAQGLVQRSNGRGVFVTRSESRLPRTGVVGFLGLRDGSGLHPYWSELVTGAQDALHHRGYDIVIVKDQENIRWERLEGVLAFGYGGLLGAKQRPLLLPMVAVMAVADNVPYLEIDEFAAVREAAKQLISMGHGKIAYLEADTGSGARYAGCVAALREAGISPQDSWRRSFITSPDGRNAFAGAAQSAMTLWLEEDWHHLGCTALMAWNDDAALGALRALRAAGVSVPGEVSMVGFDGSPLAQLCEPPLATLHVPLRHLGWSGADCLLDILRGAQVAPGKRVFQAHFQPGPSIREISFAPHAPAGFATSKGNFLRRNSRTSYFQETTS